MFMTANYLKKRSSGIFQFMMNERTDGGTDGRTTRGKIAKS